MLGGARGEVRVGSAAALAAVGFAGVFTVFVFMNRPADAPTPQPIPPAPTPRPADGDPPRSDRSTPTRLSILVDLRAWDTATSDARRAAAQDVAAREPDFTLLRLETFSCGGQTHEVAIYSHAKTGLEFVLVPGGTFLMGSPENEQGRQPDETRHPVTLTQPFLIARTPCTQAAYEKIIGTNPSNWRGPTLPVEHVSWVDANVFCGRAGLELPSEAQWEHACRSGAADAGLDSVAWFGANSGDQTHSVAQKKPNAFGIFDMQGNVWQWCADWYGDYPRDAATNPRGPSNGARRVSRGACWANSADYARSAVRCNDSPYLQADGVGLRPAKTVAP